MRPRFNTERAIEELARRPALNGGWDKLAKQQEEQLLRLRRHGARLKGLEARFGRLDRAAKWIVGACATIAISVVGRLAYDILGRVLH